MRGQGAIMDAMLFMLIASAGAVLLIYTTSLFGTNTNKQIITMYNYEYMSNAFIALHYAKDSNGGLFWNELQKNITNGGNASDYMKQKAVTIWNKVKESSPSRYIVLCWEKDRVEECYFDYTGKTYLDVKNESGITLSSSINMNTQVTLYLRLYY